MKVIQTRNSNLAEIYKKSLGLEIIIQNLIEKNLDPIFLGEKFVETDFQI